MGDIDKLCEELRGRIAKSEEEAIYLAILDDRDRLIAERDDAIKHSDQVCDSYAAENQRLFDDRDRLRKALTDIARQPLSHEPSGDIEDEELDYTDGYDLCIERARTALGEYRHD